MKYGFFKGKKVAECQGSQTGLMDRFRKHGLVDEWRDAEQGQASQAEAERVASEQAAQAEAERIALEQAQKAKDQRGGKGKF